MNITSNTTRLRTLYFFNIFGAGIPGAVMLTLPAWARANMFAGTQDPAMFGMTGSIWLAIGLAGILGIRYPNLFKGIFLIQMIYKTIWITTTALPLILQGDPSPIPMALFFAAIIVGFGYGIFGDRTQKVETTGFATS